MKIGDTFKKFMDTTAEIETKLGNPMACFLEEKEKKAHHKEVKAKGKNDN